MNQEGRAFLSPRKDCERELKNTTDIMTVGNLHVNRAFWDLLQQNGLDTFESVMAYGHVEIVKAAVRERSTARLTLRHRGAEYTFYLKRHTSPPLKEHLKLLARFSRPKSALNEWRAIIRFHELGLPTMIPVAAGEKSSRLGAVSTSFVLSLEIKDATRLDHYLAAWLGHPLSGEEIRRKRALVEEVAQLTRKMHRSGLNHRDYYLCHLFIRETQAEENFELFVLDLHRVDIRNKVGRRWIVKDLAAINYSSLELPVHTTDRLRFLKHYLGKDRLEKGDLPMIRQVLKKTRRIARHSKKMHKP